MYHYSNPMYHHQEMQKYPQAIPTQQQAQQSNYDERQFNLPGFLGQQMLGYIGNQMFGAPTPPGPPPFAGSPFTGSPPPGQPSGGAAGPPTTPPPSFTPQQQQQSVGLFAVDPGAIRGCLYRYTYVWLRRSSFWFYPVFVGRRSISGYRWTGFNWVYFGIDLDHIESFQCY